MHIREHIAFILGDHASAYANNQYRALHQFFKFLEAEEDIRYPMTGTVPGVTSRRARGFPGRSRISAARTARRTRKPAA